MAFRKTWRLDTLGKWANVFSHYDYVETRSMSFRSIKQCFIIWVDAKCIIGIMPVIYIVERICPWLHQWTLRPEKCYGHGHSDPTSGAAKWVYHTFTLHAVTNIAFKNKKLMLTNPHDAFGGHSRSPNILQFHMLGIVSY